MEKFIKTLKMLLDDKNLSQRDFAKQVGVQEATISRYLNGERNPTSELLSKMADVLNVSVDYLLGKPDDNIGLSNDELKKIANNIGISQNYLRKQLILGKFIVNPDGNLTLNKSKTKKEFSYSNNSRSSMLIAEQENHQQYIPLGKTVKIPLLGRIPAGKPIYTEQNIIDYIDTPADNVRNGEYFYLQVSGDSMTGSRIQDGDHVLVKVQQDVESGQIAVVRVNSHDATLKRVKKIDGQVILYPDNPAYEPIIVKEEGAEIIGKVVEVRFDPNKK